MNRYFIRIGVVTGFFVVVLAAMLLIKWSNKNYNVATDFDEIETVYIVWKDKLSLIHI
jgi:hypothetical protein